MIYQDKPDNFNSKFEVVSCFVEYDGEILLLHRQDHKPEGDTWGVPAGKIDDGEQPIEAMLREAMQETAIHLPSNEIVYIRKVYVRYPEYDFVYYMYHVVLINKPQVKINPKEHKDFRWTTPLDALSINLIRDLDIAIKNFYKI